MSSIKDGASWLKYTVEKEDIAAFYEGAAQNLCNLERVYDANVTTMKQIEWNTFRK